jgi:protein-disulfide isomerase
MPVGTQHPDMIHDGSQGTTRREILLGAGAGATVALAGCTNSTPGGADTVPVRGDPDADVTLEVYEDLGCPACRSYVQDVFPDIQSRYLDDGRIRYEHHDFIVTGPAAEQAASAAREVLDREGDEGFWSFTGAVFDNQGRLPSQAPGLFSTLAGNLGFDDPAAIATAGQNLEYDSAVESDMNRGRSLGVEGTPSFVVDGSLVGLRELTAELDQALADQQ